MVVTQRHIHFLSPSEGDVLGPALNMTRVFHEGQSTIIRTLTLPKGLSIEPQPLRGSKSTCFQMNTTFFFALLNSPYPNLKVIIVDHLCEQRPNRMYNWHFLPNSFQYLLTLKMMMMIVDG